MAQSGAVVNRLATVPSALRGILLFVKTEMSGTME